ncbi:MAG: beta-Ala-His dipeptidase [Bacillota bacterium]|jgi:dipeptidase D|nr:beta-Ala-His dipeptidase [Eubacteriales bacterium]MDI9492363.1 beta-Ala-His dipeptidase [Bacillota bacterium]NLV69548.1 aminoacyl-histidine dipeptidase [Clostridiales bacterium]HRV33244.1 beta-Ala-His dipeptidase [Anaerovoracaceae bacterium]MDD3537092.1 beta-Ala-His dipeptidase [Eubacteriales bacterium]
MTFEELFNDKEPKDVLRKFYDISQIPRVPGSMKPISDYMVRWAEGLGLEVFRDETNNVLVRKPASPGREDRPTIILQSHMDMVCEKEPGSAHDFENDPLRLRVVEGDKVMATGTTLGADDGIGAAQTMAILEDDSLAHPAIEALFTVDEETDMKGAWNFDCKLLKGKTMVNLDSCARMVAGSGELEYKMRFDKGTETVAPDSRVMKVRIGGLMGGHTGQNSMLERGNAIMMVNRILLELEKQMPYQLIYMQGGRGLSSAYARDASATIAFAPEYEAKVHEICDSQLAVFRYELEHRDPGVTLRLEEVLPEYDQAMDAKTAYRLRSLILLLPDGVFTRHRVYEGCMESTSNVGVVETEEREIYLTILIRSFMENRKFYLLDKVRRLCQLLDVRTELGYNIPHWEFCVSDRLMDLAAEVYGDDPVTVAQGTLETGIFCQHMPDTEIIALACPYYNAHSPEEYFLISELADSQKKLKELLAKF